VPLDHASGQVDVARVPVVSPSREDPVARVASAVTGGPAGRRLAGAAGFWRAVPVLVLLAFVAVGLGVAQKQHCRDQGWATPDQFWHACYSDIPALYGTARLGGPDPAGLREAVAGPELTQPPLAGAAMWAVARVVGESDPQVAPRRFFDLSVLLLALALAAGVTLVAVAAGRRPWDAAHLAIAPGIATAGLVSYDLLAVALVAASVWAWGRRSPVLAGAFLGLAVATRPLSALLGFAILLVAVRAGRTRTAGVTLGVGVACWLAVRLVLLPGMGAGLGTAWETWRAAGPGYGSLWFVPTLLAQNRPRSAPFWYSGPGLDAGATTTLALLAIVAVLAVTAGVALAAWRRPRLVHLALFATAGVLLVSKSVPVQASLLLLPLMALAALPWRDHLIWAATELAYFVGVWLYIAAASDANKGLPGGMYLVLVLVRLAGIGWVGAQALRAR
jgi:uncharacterized membrane protein